MLTHIIESFRATPERVEKLRELIFSYHQWMISNGFLASEFHMFVESLDAGRILAGGLLAHGDFPPTGAGLVGTSKESCNRLLAQREDITRLAAEVDIQVFNEPHSEHDHYCNHTSWSGLLLRSDWPMCVTPIHCRDCHGRVARYRVPVSAQVGSDIWSWDAGATSVEACWSASAVFEAWANGERHDPLSRINTLGLSIVKRIQADTGIDTWLYIPARKSTTVTTCPSCETEMSRVKSRFFWNCACDDCRIVTAIDVAT